MRILFVMFLLVGCLSFAGCGGVKELEATSGASDEELEKLKTEQDEQMKAAMEKMKDMQSPTGQNYQQ